MRTPEEINDTIARLRNYRDRVPSKTGFGDDNHAAIDAQLDVLDNHYDQDDCFDHYDPTGDEDIDFDEGRSEHTLDAARNAAHWLLGESDENPADDWVPILDR